MTAPTLSIEHASTFRVPCTWRDIPGHLSVQRYGSEWCVSVLPDGWAAQCLSTRSTPPFGLWSPWGRTNQATFPTADDALAAAWATEQITVHDPDQPSLFGGAV